MAANGNPFYVEPPDAFGALLAGVQGFNGARKLAKENALDRAYSDVGSQIASNGSIDNASLGRMIAMGPQAAPLLSAVASIGKADKTDLLKNLAAENAARSQRGEAPLSPLQYAQSVAHAGASRSTINMPPMEKAYDQELGKYLAESNINIIKGASTARANLGNLDRLQQLLNEPGVYQGTAGDKILQAKKLAKSMGFDVGDGIGAAETVQAISNQLALQARNPAGGAGMPGAMSDADRTYLQQMQPGLEKTPEGNRLLIDVNRKINQRAVDVEQFRQNYIRKHGRLDEGFYRDLNDWSNANPLFANSPAPPTAPPRSGNGGSQPRRAPDGNFYVPDPNRPGKYLRVVQ
jgi:hypothetical protein